MEDNRENSFARKNKLLTAITITYGPTSPVAYGPPDDAYLHLVINYFRNIKFWLLCVRPIGHIGLGLRLLFVCNTSPGDNNIIMFRSETVGRPIDDIIILHESIFIRTTLSFLSLASSVRPHYIILVRSNYTPYNRFLQWYYDITQHVCI